MEQDQTYNVRNPSLYNDAVNQIWSVNFLTGETKQETDTNSLKVAPQYVEGKGIGHLIKGNHNTSGLYYASGPLQQRLELNVSTQTNLSWSPDGTQIVFEALNMGDYNTGPVGPGAEIYSWDPNYSYYISKTQAESLSKSGLLATTPFRNSLNITYPNGSSPISIPIAVIIRNSSEARPANPLSVMFPSWSPTEEHIVVGVGGYFEDRRTCPAGIYRIRRNDSFLEPLTDAQQANSGFPSYNPQEGTDQIVYRVWGPPRNGQYGLRILDITKNETTVLTNHTLNGNLPMWSPDGERIVFTRRMNSTNFDICTIRPDGSDFQVLTTSAANDGHASWTREGRILWSSGSSGWKNEAASYDTAEQPYGQIWIMDADGGNKEQLTDSLWEDALPLYMPKDVS